MFIRRQEDDLRLLPLEAWEWTHNRLISTARAERSGARPHSHRADFVLVARSNCRAVHRTAAPRRSSVAVASVVRTLRA